LIKIYFDDGLLENSSPMIFVEAFLPRRTLINCSYNNYIYILPSIIYLNKSVVSKGENLNYICFMVLMPKGMYCGVKLTI